MPRVVNITGSMMLVCASMCTDITCLAFDHYFGCLDSNCTFNSLLPFTGLVMVGEFTCGPPYSL